ncbi:hypothetical protein [Lewinella sp. LCG006]|uniref:hypothetical protein n=1 Tax=Lewinella sp. LCG006 TaxID=3231911 RepID=UPI0034615360
MVRIVAGGDTITATNKHPIYTDPKVVWAKPKSTLIGISRLKFLGKAQNTLL